MTFTTATFQSIRADFDALVADGALVFCNHSGGKDSQALYLLLRDVVPVDQLVVIHADLGDQVEWEGVKEHIAATTDGRPLEIADAIYADGTPKDLLGYVEKRGMWPSSSSRYCTSDLKRDPIAKQIRRIMDERGAKVAINCMGLRAEESPARAKVAPWELNKRISNSRRTVWTCNPILSMLVGEVFAVIAAAGQKPHWVYAAGMHRLSCCFCVLAGEKDLALAAQLRPELAQRYVDLEAQIGHTFRATKSLAQITGVAPPPGYRSLTPRPGGRTVWGSRETPMKPRTYITKSKAGHYAVTVKDLDSRRSVSRGLIENLQQAQALVPALTQDLAALVGGL